MIALLSHALKIFPLIIVFLSGIQDWCSLHEEETIILLFSSPTAQTRSFYNY